MAPGVADDLDRFSDQVSRIRGVVSATVQKDPEVSVELIATRERGAKEIARDVQSLAAAGFGLSIDHRSITIEWEDGGNGEPPRNPVLLGRPVIRWINVSSETGGGRVDVGLQWQGKETTGGATFPLSPGRSQRGLAGAQALANALEPALKAQGRKLTIEVTQLITVAGRQWILVSGVFDDGKAVYPLLGTALVDDDSVTAAARALLDALNRSLTR